jgi:hypothetical protein
VGLRYIEKVYLDVCSLWVLVLQPFDAHFVDLLANESINLLEYRFEYSIQVRSVTSKQVNQESSALDAYAVTVMVLALMPR